MATVWRDMRTRGRAVWCIRYKGLDGRWHRERTPATTKDQAQAILHKKTSELVKAQVAGAHSIEAIKPLTLEEFVDQEYLPHCRATHTPDTYRTDEGLATILKKEFGKTQLRAIAAGDIQRYVDRLTGEKSRFKRVLTPATINRRRTFLSGILTEALRRGYVDRNPARVVENLPEHNDKLRWLTPKEEGELLTFSPPHLQSIIRFALQTGMRKGEILGLKWSDVDFEQRLVRVTQTKNHRTRYVPMSRELVEILQAIDHVAGPTGHSPYVFTDPKSGTSETTATRFQDVNHAFEKAAGQAGLEEVTFHTLRHTFASRLAQAGVPLNTIRELLGHGTMQVTMRYAHLAPNNLRDAVELLAGLAATPERTQSVQAGGAPAAVSRPARKALR